MTPYVDGFGGKQYYTKKRITMERGELLLP
jgi:hypothetical protein